MEERRDKMADVQLHLLRVLGGQALPGKDFDHSSLDMATEVINAKRMRAVAKHWPAIPKALGTQYRPLFEAYAAKVSLPTDGAKADARAFMRDLQSDGKLPDKLRVTLLKDPLTRFPFRIARLKERFGLALAVRLPKFGVRVWSLGIGSAKKRA